MCAVFVTLPHFHYPVVEPTTYIESFASIASNIHSNRRKKNENNKRRKKRASENIPTGETTQTPRLCCVANAYIHIHILPVIASRQLCITITNSNKCVQSCLWRFLRICYVGGRCGPGRLMRRTNAEYPYFIFFHFFLLDFFAFAVAFTVSTNVTLLSVCRCIFSDMDTYFHYCSTAHFAPDSRLATAMLCDDQRSGMFQCQTMMYYVDAEMYNRTQRVQTI